MMCDRACTPPQGRSPPHPSASRRGNRSSGGGGLFGEVDPNTMPCGKGARVERRLGLDDEEEGEGNDYEVVSAAFSTPRGSWPLQSTQLPPPADRGRASHGSETGTERPSGDSLGGCWGNQEPAANDGVSAVPAQAFTAVPPPLQCCWQTPEVNRGGGAVRMTGGNFGLPIAPSLLYTPQITAGLLARRHNLDAELEAVNAAHRMHPMPPVTPLLPGKLYIGGFPDEETVSILRSEGIRYIINCASQDYITERAVAEEFCVIDMEAFDTMDYLILFHDYEHFAHVVDDITERKHEKVFVHCIAGINRSVTLCCAYLMEKLGCNPIDAVRLFRANGRMRILENVSFRHQLIDHYLQVVLPKLNEEEEGDALAGETESHQR